ncbi:MAG: LamG domain-containing protein, partial [bacterium]
IASCSTTVTLSASSSAAAGLRNVTVSASGGQATASASVAVTVTAAAAQPAPETPASSGLAARWKFDEGSGTFAADSSGNHNDGILRGATTWNTSGGKTAVQFRNTGDHVEINTGQALSLTREITVSFWIMAQDVANVDERIIAKSYCWDVKLNGSKRIIQFTAGGKYAQLNYSLPVGSWKHVVITYSSGTVTGYVDGKKVAVATSTFGRSDQLPNSNYGLVIGSDASRTNSMKGMLDDVRIYSRALKNSEAAALYSAGR